MSKHMDTLLKARDDKVSRDESRLEVLMQRGGCRLWEWVYGYSNASWQRTLWQASGISPGFPSLSLLLSAGQGIYWRLNQMLTCRAATQSTVSACRERLDQIALLVKSLDFIWLTFNHGIKANVSVCISVPVCRLTWGLIVRLCVMCSGVFSVTVTVKW